MTHGCPLISHFVKIASSYFNLLLLSTLLNAADIDRLQELENFYRVHDTIQAHYADTARTNTRQLMQSALRGMVGGLDPYSQYFTPEDYARMRREGRGELAGVGLTLSGAGGGARIVAVLPNSPAEKSGILVGSRISRIDGESVGTLFISEIVEKLRGAEGTEVSLELIDENTGSHQTITLKRALFQVPSIARSETLSGGHDVAFIKLTYFNEDAAEEFSQKLDQLLSKNPAALVLDLRGNPGGSLDAAKKIASHFLKPGETIARLESRTQSRNESITSVFTAKTVTLPIAVLVNRGTASAAEMLAAALQEHRKAVIVGERSFGKGSIQSLFDLPDGAGLRLTTAFYLTPSGKRIEETGVTPDIEVFQSPTTQAALRARELGLMRDPDSPAPIDDQLQRAADALRAVVTYRKKMQTN